MKCARCGSTERYKNGRCAPCTRASNQRWKERNRDRHRAGSLRWQEQNVEARRTTTRDWARRNRAAVAETRRRWREKFPERHVAHEHARRARRRANGGNYKASEWLELCEFFGGRCLRCGRTDIKLTVDHVIPMSRGGTNDILNIQPLCGQCNSAKGATVADYREHIGGQLLAHLGVAAHDALALMKSQIERTRIQ